MKAKRIAAALLAIAAIAVASPAAGVAGDGGAFKQPNPINWS